MNALPNLVINNKFHKYKYLFPKHSYYIFLSFITFYASELGFDKNFDCDDKIIVLIDHWINEKLTNALGFSDIVFRLNNIIDLSKDNNLTHIFDNIYNKFIKPYHSSH